MISINSLITVINVIFVFFLVVMFHEFGHFSVAKLVGIKVHEFAIGMGPKIFNKKIKDTDYTLRIFPIGGFVKMEGEDENSYEEGSFNNKSISARMAVISAGAIMNFVLTILLFTIVFYNSGKPLNKPIIGDITIDEPAYNVGLKPGDRVLSINNIKIETWKDIQNTISKSSSDSINVTIEREGKILSYKVKPLEVGNRRIIGIMPLTEKSVIHGFKYSLYQTKYLFNRTFDFFGRLIRGDVKGEEVGGPVKIVSIIGEASQYGFMNVLFLTGFLSFNLGFFNLLPIPALDGSRLVFLFIEFLRGKPIDPEKEGFVHFVGFVFLILLMIVVAYKDFMSL